jgi:hypothetical protein
MSNTIDKLKTVGKLFIKEQFGKKNFIKVCAQVEQIIDEVDDPEVKSLLATAKDGIMNGDYDAVRALIRATNMLMFKEEVVVNKDLYTIEGLKRFANELVDRYGFVTSGSVVLSKETVDVILAIANRFRHYNRGSGYAANAYLTIDPNISIPYHSGTYQNILLGINIIVNKLEKGEVK